MKYDYISEKGVQSLLNKIMDTINSIYIYLTGDAIRMWAAAFMLVTILAVLFLQNWIMSCILLLVIPLNFGDFILINTQLYKKSLTLQTVTADGIQQCCSIMGCIDYLKQSPDHTVVSQKLKTIYDKMYACMADVNKFAQVSSDFIITVDEVLQVI